MFRTAGNGTATLGGVPQPSQVHALLAVLAGCALFTLAAVYFVEPAGALPGFLPGHVGARDPERGEYEIVPATIALAVGLAAFAYAWVTTGSES